MNDDNAALFLLFFVILTGVSTCNYQVHQGNKIEASRELVKVKAGLQECQIIGSSTIVWQKECLVPKKQ